MKKILDWFKAHLPTKRRLIQIYCALLFNANIKGFFTGKIYQGPIKNVCTPGLNCYSCPGASGACPIGSLQNAFSASGKRAPYYVIGIILLYSILFGRMICGFFCPFGLVQELLYKIKTPKLKKSKVTRVLSLFKYVILVFMVVIVPILYMFRERGIPAFCKYICPAGVLEGGIGLLSHIDNAAELANLGPLFTWKFSLFVICIVGSVFIFRFFCRFLCPLGALYGIFNRFSILGIKLDKDKCIDCGRCHAKCKVDIKHVGDRECVNCGECLSVCPTNAISWRGSKIFLPANEIDNEISPALTDGEKEAIEKKKSSAGRRRLIIKIVAGVLAASLLIGALVYYNFIYKDPSDVILTPRDEFACADENLDGSCDKCGMLLTDVNGNPISYGNQLGDLCIGAHLELLNGDGKTGEMINPVVTEGKIVIINFWGVWCDGCKKELPDFNRIADDYSDEVTVIAIHTSTDETLAPDFIKNNYADWDNMVFALDRLVPGSTVDEYFTSLGFSGSYPVTVILNPDGGIEYRYTSELAYDQLKSAIETIKSYYE